MPPRDLKRLIDSAKILQEKHDYKKAFTRYDDILVDFDVTNDNVDVFVEIAQQQLDCLIAQFDVYPDTNEKLNQNEKLLAAAKETYGNCMAHLPSTIHRETLAVLLSPLKEKISKCHEMLADSMMHHAINNAQPRAYDSQISKAIEHYDIAIVKAPADHPDLHLLHLSIMNAYSNLMENAAKKNDMLVYNFAKLVIGKIKDLDLESDEMSEHRYDVHIMMFNAYNVVADYENKAKHAKYLVDHFDEILAKYEADMQDEDEPGKYYNYDKNYIDKYRKDRDTAETFLSGFKPQSLKTSNDKTTNINNTNSTNNNNSTNSTNDNNNAASKTSENFTRDEETEEFDHSPAKKQKTSELIPQSIFIKSEFDQSAKKHVVDINFIKQKISFLIKKGREKSNTQNNCGLIAAYAVSSLLKLLNGEDAPVQKISTNIKENDASTATYLKIMECQIKNEDGTPATSGNKKRSSPLKQFRTVRSVSQITEKGLYSIYQPQPKPYIDVEDNNQTHVYMDIDPNHQFNIMVKTKDLPQVLMNAARQENRVLVGCVNFAATGKNLVGHTIAFCASKDDIFFVDGQLYNGIKDTGEPVFTSLENTYTFAKLIKGQEKGDFADDCFYRVLASVNAEMYNSISMDNSNNSGREFNQ